MARQAQAWGYTLVALGTPEVARLDAVTAPTPCVGTIRSRRPIPCGGKGAVSSHASTVHAARPDTTRNDSRSPLQTTHPHRVSSLGVFYAALQLDHGKELGVREGYPPRCPAAGCMRPV